MLDADGSICIARKGSQQLVARVMFAQSNLAFLTAINAEFGYTGSIYTRSKAAVDYNEGRYSKGELRQMLSFECRAAGDVAAELQPHTVTKAPHIEIVLDMLKHPAGPSGTSARQQCYKHMQDLHSKDPDDSDLVVQNITPEWLAGMFDGDGCIWVKHNLKVGRSQLALAITQSKSRALLLATQAVHRGNIQRNPHRLVWTSAQQLPAIVKILRRHLVTKRQKLDTLLQHLFKVDINNDHIKGAGAGGAFSCPSPMKGWTAESWCDYLCEPLLPWSR
ncbi:hypothetical protein WJX77_007038 [Trebouxia sp. C0004]